MAGKRPSDAMAVVTSSANLHLGLFGDLQREMRMPIRRIRELFRFALPNATVDTMAATGHMGPITHTDAVNALLVSHIQETIAGLHRRAA